MTRHTTPDPHAPEGGPDPIRFACFCGTTLKARPEAAGKPGDCPACGRVVIVPRPPDPSADSTLVLAGGPSG